MMILMTDEILRIPLANRNADDTLIWHYSRNGRYSVSSAYHLAMTIKHMRLVDAQGSTSNSSVRNWNFVWSLKLPGKIKHFLWRLLHDSIPTSSELKRRHVTTEEHCPVCGGNNETALHIMRDCHFSRMYWALANFPATCIYFPCDSTWDWVNGVRVRMDGKEFDHFVVSCWCIW